MSTVVIGGCDSLTWQNPFPDNTACVHCGSNARRALCAREDGAGGVDNKYVCELHQNQQEGKFWPHDAIAYALYFCEQCAKSTSLYNQA